VGCCQRQSNARLHRQVGFSDPTAIGLFLSAGETKARQQFIACGRANQRRNG
jgi:hypothetical protein